MITLQTELTGQTDYVAKAYLPGSSVVVGSFSLVEILPGFYSTNALPTGLSINPTTYNIGFEKGGVSLKAYSTYAWSGTAEITPSVLLTLLNSLPALTAVTETVNTAVNSSQITVVAAVSTAQTTTTTAINAARDVITTRGDTTWATGNIAGIPTAVQTQLASQLNQISSDSALSRKEALNSVIVNLNTSIASIYDDDGITVVASYQLLDENNVPSTSRVIKRIKQ